jgi:hypothetical protein
MAFWRTTQTVPTVPVRPPLPTPSEGQQSEHFFRAWTEDLYISGFVPGSGRLSDVLNAREPINVQQPKIHALRAAGWPTRPDGDVVLDPFDLEFVLGHAMTGSDVERAAKRVHKVQYPVLVEGQNFEIIGTMHIFPGNAPEFAVHRSSQLFLPITEPSVRREQRLVSDRYTDVVLVNRYAVRSIRQLDTPIH